GALLRARRAPIDPIHHRAGCPKEGLQRGIVQEDLRWWWGGSATQVRGTGHHTGGHDAPQLAAQPAEAGELRAGPAGDRCRWTQGPKESGISGGGGREDGGAAVVSGEVGKRGSKKLDPPKYVLGGSFDFQQSFPCFPTSPLPRLH